jgi:photosystem II stability/assembly factor-like uncharacterized protein
MLHKKNYLATILLLTLLLLGNLRTVKALGNWQFPSTPFRNIDFVTSEIVWVAYDSTLAATFDAGNSWTKYTLPKGISYPCVDFIGATQGWAVSADEIATYVWQTTNGGQTWKELVRFPGNIMLHINQIHFSNSQNGWLRGTFGLWRSENGGQTWQLVLDPKKEKSLLGSAAFQGDAKAWVILQDRRLFHTKDGGQSWEEQYFANKSPLHSISFIREELGWLGSSPFYATDNGGQAWLYTADRTKDSPTCLSASFLNQREGVCVGLEPLGSLVAPVLWITADAGMTWQSNLAQIKDDMFLRVYYPTQKRIWGVGSRYLYYTDDKGGNWHYSLKF